MSDICSALREYDKYLSVELERCLVSPDSSAPGYGAGAIGFASRTMIGRLDTSVYGDDDDSTPSIYVTEERARLLPFDAWLASPQYNSAGLVERIARGSDIKVLYGDNPLRQISAIYVLDDEDQLSRVQRIGAWRERTANILKEVRLVEIERVEIEQANSERQAQQIAEEQSRDADLQSVVAVPRALSKPGMALTRDPQYLDDYWRFYVFKGAEDASSTFYGVDSFAKFRAKHPSVCVSAGSLVATAYRAFIDDLRTPQDAIKIADSLYYPVVEESEDGRMRYSVLPVGNDEYSYRAWAWAAGARFRDQRVELALLEHFSYLAAISWLVWNPVDRDMLKTLIEDANKHAHKVLHKALKRHYVRGDRSDSFKNAKKRIGHLLHSKHHGIVAKAMRRRDKDDDGYPDGWMIGLARFVFSDSVGGSTGRLDSQFYRSFTRETLRPLARAIEIATRLCRREESARGEDDTSSDDDMDADDVEDDTALSVGDYRMIEYSRDGSGRFCVANIAATPPAAINFDDLVYRVNEVCADGDLSAMTSVSGYLIDYENPEDRVVRINRVRDLLRYELRDSLLTSAFVPNTEGSMCPRLNLTRPNLYALANIVTSDDHAFAKEASAACLTAEALFFAIAQYCAQRQIDWTLVGHALPRLTDSVDERVVELVESEPARDEQGENGTRFVSVAELLWSKALNDLYHRCVTSAARAIVDAIYPREGSESSDNRLLALVSASEVFSRENKAKSRLARFVSAAAEDGQIDDAERAFFLGAVLYDLLRRCVAYSRARVLAAIRLAQEAHAAVVRRQVSCASAFEVDARDLFRATAQLDTSANDHVVAALRVYRSAAQPVDDGFESKLVSSFGIVPSAAQKRAIALHRVAELAKDGRLFALRPSDLTAGERSQCVRALAATMGFVRADIVKIDSDDSLCAKVAILPVLVDKRSLGQFVASNLTSILTSARSLGGVDDIDSMSVADVGMAVALSNNARRLAVYASAYAAMCYLASNSDASRRLFSLAADAARNAALRSGAERTMSCDIGPNTKLMGTCAPAIRADSSHREVVAVFGENNAESAYRRIAALAEAAQLFQFLSKDTEHVHSKTPFLGAIKRVAKDGSVSLRIVGTRDLLSGADGFRRTVSVDLAECRRAYNLCRTLLPLFRAGVQLAKASAGASDDQQYAPFVSVADVVAASNRNKVLRVLDDGSLLRGVVHRYESQSDAHMALLSASVVRDLFARVAGTQEPDSAFVVQCANMPRYSAECIDGVRHYLDYLARRWSSIELAVELFAHRRAKERAEEVAARYGQSPLSRYLAANRQDDIRNHYRFVRLLHDNVSNRFALARYAWLVPPDDDVSLLLGASPSQEQIEELILRCCIPPSFCDPLVHGVNWNVWKQRYRMCPFSRIDHHVHHDVPRAGEFYCVKRIAPPLSADMRQMLRARLANALVDRVTTVVRPCRIDSVHSEAQLSSASPVQRTRAIAASSSSSSSQQFTD